MEKKHIPIILIWLLVAGCDMTFPNKYSDNQIVDSNDIKIDTVFSSPLDSLEWIFNNTVLPVSIRLEACDRLSFDLAYVDVNKAKHFALKGLDMSENEKMDDCTGLFYRDLGMAYAVMGLHDSAHIYYHKALQSALAYENEDLESLLYLALGLLYSNTNRYERSAEYYEKALHICENKGYERRYGAVLLNIAITYLKMSNYEHAERYFLKAKEVFQGNPSPDVLAHVYLNMGIMYVELNRLEEARAVSGECLKMFQALSNTSGEALALMNYSRLFAADSNYQQAMEVAHQSLVLAEESGFTYVIKKALSELSHLYYKTGDYRLSEEYASKEIALIDSTEATEHWLLYKELVKIYIQQGKKEDAIHSFAIFDSLTTMINSAQVQTIYNELEVKYETEKKELRISALETEKRMMMWLAGAGGLVLLLALSAFFFLWRWTVQKRRLADQQKQLAEQQIIQLEQEKRLIATQAVLDGETTERTRLARDLHDGLGGKLTGIRLQLQALRSGARLDSVGMERFTQVLELLDDSVREMRRVSHNLMPEALSSAGLKQAVADFCRSMSPIIVFRYYGNEARLDPNLELLIYRCIHELANNALKYADASQIIIQIMQRDGSIDFTVEDDGCGFEPSAITQGVGLKNVRSRVASYGGNLQIDSRVGEGTEINVQFNY